MQLFFVFFLIFICTEIILNMIFDTKFGCVSIVVIFTLSCFSSLIVSTYLYEKAPKETVIIKETRMYSSKDNIQSNVTFGLFSTHSNDRISYYYYVKTPKGKQVRKLEDQRDNIYIKEREDAVPRHIIKKRTIKNPKNWPFALKGLGPETHYLIVPKGTVIKNKYDYDLE